METLAFTGRMGASGDMIVGALLAMGADPSHLTPIEKELNVQYDIERVETHGIAATQVTVTRNDEPLEGHRNHRSYNEVINRVGSLPLPEETLTDAKAIFEVLGTAESRVHDTELRATEFHEIGADDAIADIVGAAVLIHHLSPDHIITTPVSVGDGEITIEHGTYPVPPPAVIEIARDADWAIRGGPVEAELLTPTGAAILAYYASGVDTLPPLRITRNGYGIGKTTFADRPNVLPVIGGAGRLIRDEVRLLETNVDDVSPEILGGLHDTLTRAGARDISIVPLKMKKSRPGHLIKVITRPEHTSQVARVLARETGTLGIRETGVTHRWIANREIETVTIEVAGLTYSIDVKIARDESDDVYDVSAEYEDAVSIAEETDLPIREVMQLAESVWQG